jgi:methylated-DNA-protein-cysteine methyltransferase-like protein
VKAKSPFFARIQGDVLAIVAAVPQGRLITFAEVGAHLDVMPRHVAYILAMLDGPERDAIPWHRALAADGRVEKPAQRAALAAEGFRFDPDGRVSGFLAHVTPVVALPHGVAAQKRPADAPAARARRTRR